MRLILQEIFYILSASLVVFGVLEILWSNVILFYINLNLVLILWFLNGIMLLALKKE